MRDDPLNRTKVKRGMDLPQSKLTDEDILLIRGLVDERNKMKADLRNLTNSAIADKFGVHVRTIDRVTCYESWTHV